jgi:alkanesulfonate monooxygenase SsuD/methylene tetrahydromethanopterin reductase-like flavin-dependent oxidoreductase (luciferase family)
MQVGIGLPNTVPGVEREGVLEWARLAEREEFSTLASLDRLVYPGWEALISLAGAAAVTERIGLTTNILIVPFRQNAAYLAKQAATLDRLSRGRLSLGVAVGLREDDYEASGVPFGERGRLMDEMVERMVGIWRGSEQGVAKDVGPPPFGGELMFGGAIESAFRRAARYGAGWTASGGAPEQFVEGREAMLKAWGEEGREGDPKFRALAYYALGPDAEEDARHDLVHYYAWLGEETANMIAQSAATTDEMVAQYVGAFEQAGCDELIFFPTSTKLDQVERLRAALS